jgi:hypothetical protein
MLAVLFVVLAIAARFLLLMVPHLWLNFTPVGASLLFFGARGSRKLLWFPVVALAASDVILTKFHYGYSLTPDHYLTWVWYAAILALGTLLRKNQSGSRIFGASLATAISFFLLSNFAVWMVWDMYPKTVSGLLACYTMALPFFRNEVVSDVLFTAVLFAIPAGIAMLKPHGAKQIA